MTCDPNWLNVSLLLPFDGTNGQTTTTDYSGNNYPMTVGGSTSLSTTSPQFGTACANFAASAGTGVYTTITPSGPLDLRQAVFTVEMWVRTTSPGTRMLWSDDGGGAEYMRGYLNNGYVTFEAQFNIGGGGGSESSTAINDGNWHHVVYEASATQYGMAVDGTWLQIDIYGFSGDPIASGQNFYIGSDATAPQGNSMVGQIDEVRVTKGLLRYPLGANFTPPSAPFPIGPCGLNAVPDVTNTSIAVAAATLAGAGFGVGTVSEQENVLVLKGNVISQSPVAGTNEPAGTLVNLVISEGRAGLFVPLILGDTLTQAINALTPIGLVPGSIGYAPSTLTPAGEVMSQNPSAGSPVASGSFVSFVISTGVPDTSTAFNIEATVISQYANSPTLTQLIQNLAQYFDQSANFAEFFNYVWNVDTAVGFGLDIWGVIVGVSRLLNIPNTTDYVGFDNSHSPPDWQTMGSDQPPQPAVGGAMYTGYNATTAYLLPDNAYRQLILAKAFANICTTTAPAINQILQNLLGEGAAWVLNAGVMSISYNLNFTPTAIQLAILEQSGVIPTPPGVSFVVNTDV